MLLLFLKICVFFLAINDYKGMQGGKGKSHNLWIYKFWKLRTTTVFGPTLGHLPPPPPPPRLLNDRMMRIWFLAKCQRILLKVEEWELCVIANFSSKNSSLYNYQLIFIGTHITFIMTSTSICFIFNTKIKKLLLQRENCHVLNNKWSSLQYL